MYRNSWRKPKLQLGFSGISSFSYWSRNSWIWLDVYICVCTYMNFRIKTQFYINFSRQELQIDVLYVSFNAWDSQVSSFHFSFAVLLSINVVFIVQRFLVFLFKLVMNEPELWICPEALHSSVIWRHFLFHLYFFSCLRIYFWLYRKV